LTRQEQRGWIPIHRTTNQNTRGGRMSTRIDTPIAGDTIVNDAVREYPATLAVFQAYGIDACCGGAATIGEAAARDGAEPGALLAALNAAAAPGPAAPPPGQRCGCGCGHGR
jgi:hypothetical protein